MDTNNYIKYYKNIVGGDLCSSMINHKFSYEPSTYSTHDSGARMKNDRVVSNDFWVRKHSIYYQELKSCYEDVVKRYNLDFDLFTVQHLTDFRITKYETGGFMSRHVDNIHHSHGQQWGYPQATSLLFLNDD